MQVMRSYRNFKHDYFVISFPFPLVFQLRLPTRVSTICRPMVKATSKGPSFREAYSSVVNVIAMITESQMSALQNPGFKMQDNYKPEKNSKPFLETVKYQTKCNRQVFLLASCIASMARTWSSKCH